MPPSNNLGRDRGVEHSPVCAQLQNNDSPSSRPLIRIEPPLARWPRPWHGRPVGTGHQARIWHPGILAKFLAVRAVCTRFDALPLHLVVDQDAHKDALTLELPWHDGNRLKMHTVQLAPCISDVPTGWQEPVNPAVIRTSLHRAGAPQQLIEAFTSPCNCRSLAEQLATVLQRLIRPWAGWMPILFASELGRIFDYDLLLGDARACAQTYNAAIALQPQATIASLRIEPQRVELPVWAIAWRRPRRRVFADLTGQPRWVFGSGEPVNRNIFGLAPRALLMTAIVRQYVCGLFVHGTGGVKYDQVTQQWWESWRGQRLAPITLATADLMLEFGVPLADRAALHHAVWYRHHLPHNIDRALGSEDSQKRLLFRVKDRAAFEQLHRINESLVAANPHLITEADRELERAQVGLANAKVANKRDWCFPLYSHERIDQMRDMIYRTIST